MSQINLFKKLNKLSKSNRAVSPAVSAIFLIAIMLAAISISLGFIYPQVQTVNDKINASTSGSSFINMDKTIKSLIINGENSKTFMTMDIGSEAFLTRDNTSISDIYMLYKIDNNPFQSIATYHIPLTRIYSSTSITKPIVPENSHRYLIGSGDQDLFYLNSSSKANIPWTNLNQSRGNQFRLNTSLSYRNIITIDKQTDVTTSTVNVTIVVQVIKFIFVGKSLVSSKTPSLSILYRSINTTLTDMVTLTDAVGTSTVFYLKTKTVLDGFSLVEVPFTHEVPQDGTLNLRMKFIVHNIIIDF